VQGEADRTANRELTLADAVIMTGEELAGELWGFAQRLRSA
jgi:hypothetical protein